MNLRNHKGLTEPVETVTLSLLKGMKGLSIFLIISLFVSIFSSCKKDSGEISVIPEIEFVSVTPSNMVEYQDSLVFTISYRDGDGDLGEDVTGAENLFLTDSRNDVTYKFRIPQLAPDNANIAIQGNLNVTLSSTAILDGSASQSFNYSIYVVDRAGNQSNTVTSSTVVVNAQ